MSDGVRREQDSMGPLAVPENAYYGAQTARARDNFPISGIRFPRSMIRALGEIKRAAAIVNAADDRLPSEIAEAIVKAAEAVCEGRLDNQFILDVFQTGSGTSTNMNINEVIAGFANERLTGKRGGRSPVHPNDHVNMGQSSNDVFPTAIHLAVLDGLTFRLLPSLEELQSTLLRLAEETDDVIRIGRTHLMDATPVRFGQVFRGYATMIGNGCNRLRSAVPRLGELALGGTAVGTGINTMPGFGSRVSAELSSRMDLTVCEAPDHFEAQGSRDALVEASGALKTVAVSLMKIANDIRWLGSGPRCGLGEIVLPPVQPGSSIMPGKVNPVMAEALCQVCAQVMGNDTTVTIAGQSGNFELNVMMPVMAHNILESIALMAAGVGAFRTRCLAGLQVDREQCERAVEQSLAMCTALAPRIGYDKAAELAKSAWESGRTVREVALEQNILPVNELEQVLDPLGMTEPDQG